MAVHDTTHELSRLLGPALASRGAQRVDVTLLETLALGRASLTGRAVDLGIVRATAADYLSCAATVASGG